MDVNLLRETLNDYTSENGYTFSTRPLDDGDGLEVIVEDRDELPIHLSVDDEQTLREQAATPFRERGDDVSTAVDGLDALGKCLKVPPDILLTDVNMPGGTLKDWGAVYLVRTLHEFEDLEQLRRTVVREGPEGRVRVEDVARVYRGHRDRDEITRSQGAEVGPRSSPVISIRAAWAAWPSSGSGSSSSRARGSSATREPRRPRT